MPVVVHAFPTGATCRRKMLKIPCPFLDSLAPGVVGTVTGRYFAMTVTIAGSVLTAYDAIVSLAEAPGAPDRPRSRRPMPEA